MVGSSEIVFHVLPQNESLNPTRSVSVVFSEQADLKQFGDGEGQPDDKRTRDENGKQFVHWFRFDALSMAADGVLWGKWWTLCQLVLFSTLLALNLVS